MIRRTELIGLAIFALFSSTSASACGLLVAGETLRSGESIMSCNKQYTLTMQGNGNLVLRNQSNEKLWTSRTRHKHGATLSLHANGSLVLRDQSNRKLWSSKMPHAYGDYLAVQDDGNMVLYRDSVAIWSADKSKAPAAARTRRSGTTDWSLKLDPTWGCGQVLGTRWDIFKKSVLFHAASGGYRMKAMCNSFMAFNGTRHTYFAPHVIIVNLKDTRNVVRYQAWYDANLDRNGSAIYGGIEQVTKQGLRDPRTGSIVDLPSQPYQRGCGGKMPKGFQLNIAYGDDSYMLTTYFCNADASDSRGRYRFRKGGTDVFSTVAMIGVQMASTWAGAGIGGAIGLGVGTVSNAAFAAGFAGFINGVSATGSGLEGLWQGLQNAAMAYTGHLIVSSLGDVNAKVGVSGLGCPTGDQCWYFRMANGFPPLKKLAELHDPFIDFSETAFVSLKDNPWFKAVTIPPFAPVGCAGSPGCLATGLFITREEEGP